MEDSPFALVQNIEDATTDTNADTWQCFALQHLWTEIGNARSLPFVEEYNEFTDYLVKDLGAALYERSDFPVLIRGVLPAVYAGDPPIVIGFQTVARDAEMKFPALYERMADATWRSESISPREPRDFHKIMAAILIRRTHFRVLAELRDETPEQVEHGGKLPRLGESVDVDP